MRSVSFSAYLLTFIILTSGCSFERLGKGRIRVELPDEPPELARNGQGQGQGGSNLLSQLKGPLDSALIGVDLPSSPGIFDCFGLHVSGAGIIPNNNVDSCPENPPMGIIGGLASVSAGSIELDVPFGTARTIQLFVVQSKVGCPKFLSSQDFVNYRFGSEDLGVPFEVSRKTLDISGDMSIELIANWDPLNPKKMFCPMALGIPQKLALLVPPDVSVGQCIPIKVGLLDSSGSLSTSKSLIDVIVSDSAQGSFFEDSLCSTPLAQVTANSSKVPLAAGSSNTKMYFLGAVSDQHILSASYSGLVGATVAVMVNPTPQASQEPTSSPSLNMTIAGPSPSTWISGNTSYFVDYLVNYSSDVSNIGLTSGHVTTHTTGTVSGCEVWILNTLNANLKGVRITNCNGTLGSTLKISIAQNSASDDSGNMVGSVTSLGVVNFVSGPPAQLKFSDDLPPSIVAGATIIPFVTVHIKDAYGNIVPSATPTIYLIGKNGAVLTGTINKVATSGIAVFNNISVKNTGSAFRLQAQTNFPTLTTTSLNFSVIAAPATKLFIDFIDPVNPTNLTKNFCSPDPFALRSKDSYLNLSPVSATTTIQLQASTNETGIFYSDSNCLSPLSGGQTTIPSGYSEILFYVKAHLAGSGTIFLTTSIVSGQSLTPIPRNLNVNYPSNSWEAVATPPPILNFVARTAPTAVWTGSEVIVWGGEGWNGVSYYDLDNGIKYDPATDNWSPLTFGNSPPSARHHHTAIWTGSVMVIWGGAPVGGGYLNSGSIYNPATTMWSDLPIDAFTPSARGYHSAVWTGSKMIIWGGKGNDGPYLDSGSIFDPSLGSWTQYWGYSGELPPARAEHSAVWTGSKMIIWGGEISGGGKTRTAGVYDYLAQTWESMGGENFILNTSTLSPRSAHVAVWTGTEMIIWGGCDGSIATNDGARYKPGDGVNPPSWTLLPLISAPGSREEPSATWILGIGMFIWGGQYPDTNMMNTGGIYYPP